jgi:hypothetical protein
MSTVLYKRFGILSLDFEKGLYSAVRIVYSVDGANRTLERDKYYMHPNLDFICLCVEQKYTLPRRA